METECMISLVTSVDLEEGGLQKRRLDGIHLPRNINNSVSAFFMGALAWVYHEVVIMWLYLPIFYSVPPPPPPPHKGTREFAS